MSSETVFSPFPIPVIAESVDQHAAAASARARGYAAGYADGLRRAAAEQAEWVAVADTERAAESDAAAQRVAQLVHALRSAAVELSECTLPVIDEAESAIVEAAFALAEAVVGVALRDPLAAARAAVERVLGDEHGGAVGIVRLNPADLESLLEHDAGALPDAVRFVPDAAIARGDAIGELPDGWLDARIRTALDRAREVLS